MKRWNLREWKIKPVPIDQLDDRLLMVNLLITQAATFLIGFVITLFQGNYIWNRFSTEDFPVFLYWGAGFALAVLAADLLVSRWVPEDVSDDGGINKALFGGRPVWMIAVISLLVAFCEEILFRGAIQHAFGAYWTSVLFAAIHVRYLQSWIMTGLVFLISYGLGWIYLHTGTLWTPVSAHFLIDFAMGCILRYSSREK